MIRYITSYLESNKIIFKVDVKKRHISPEVLKKWKDVSRYIATFLEIVYIQDDKDYDKLLNAYKSNPNILIDKNYLLTYDQIKEYLC